MLKQLTLSTFIGAVLSAAPIQPIQFSSWQLVDSPIDSFHDGKIKVVPPGAFPLEGRTWNTKATWYSDTSCPSCLSPYPPWFNGSATGFYTFQVTFDLPENFTHANIHGKYYSDGPTEGITLNEGVYEGHLATSYSHPSVFEIQKFFTVGENKFQIKVYNTNGPMGLGIEELRGWYQASGGSPVPEPGTWMMIVVGVGLVTLRRKLIQ